MVKKEKICGILQEIVNVNAKTFLIVGAGINTNVSPIIKNYKTTSLSSMLKKKIDNYKILNKVIKNYEKFIQQTSEYNFIELKKKILKNK